MADEDVTIGLEASPIPKSEFEQFAERRKRMDQIRSRVSMDFAVRQNPDEQAKVDDLAQQTGLPHSTVENNLSEVEQRTNQIDPSNFADEAPTLFRKLQDPRFAGITHDDLENLVQLERSIRRANLTYTEKIGANFRKNQAVVESSEIGFQGILFELGKGEGITEQMQNRLGELDETMHFTHDSSFLAGVPIEAIGQLPILIDVIGEGGVAAAFGAAAGAAVGGLITKTPAGAAAGARVGGGLAFKAGVIQAVFKLEGGLAFLDYTRETDNLNPVNRKLAAQAAVTVGAINAMAEFFSLSLLGRTLQPALRNVIRRRVRQMMATETGKQIVKRIAGRYAGAVLGEGITEAFQEITLMMGAEFVEQFEAGQDITQEQLNSAFNVVLDKAPEIILSDEALASGKVGLQASIGLAGVGSSANATTAIVKHRGQQSKTRVEQRKIDNIVETSNDSKVRDRSGRVFRQTIQEVSDEIEATTGEVSQIHWTAREAQAWLESEGIDIAETPDNPAIASIIEQLPEALSTDGEITLSIADFATDIAPSESFQETVRPHIKLSPDAFTPDEVANADETIEKRVKKLIADAQDSAETQRQADVIANDVITQLIDTGRMKADIARASAQPLLHWVLTKAHRTGETPEQVYARMGLKIVGPEAAPLGEGALEQGDVVRPETLQAKLLGEIGLERTRLEKEQSESTAERAQIIGFLANLISPVSKTDTLPELPAITLTDDKVVQDRLAALLFRGNFEPDVELRSGADQSTVLQRGEKPATAEQLLEQVRELEARDSALSAKQKTQPGRTERLDERVSAIFSGTTRRVEQSSELADFLSRAIKRFAMEEEGQAILDDMIEDEITPRSVSERFWPSTYLALNAENQRRFQRMLDGLGFKPGFVGSIDADGTENVLDDWIEVGEFVGEDLPDSAESLEGTERGYVALMKWANDTAAERFQVLQQDTRGEILLSDDGQGAIIRLTEASDMSTFLHESAHLFLDMERLYFEDPNISAEAKADAEIILEWLGVSDFDSITAEHHEKWAQGFEAYLFEGKAPSAELKPIFRRFAEWLRQVYQGVRKLDIKLTPEIRGVMDRMLATDDQIQEVKAGMALEPLFQTAEEADMTPKEFADYQRKTQGAAEEELRTAVLKQLIRTTKKWWKEELNVVREEVADEIEARALYRAISFMRATDVPEGFDENKMDRRAVYEMLGLPVPKDVTTDPTGVDPSQDTLTIAVTKLGGLDREEAERQGVDPAHWLPVTRVVKGQRRNVPNPENLPIGVTKPTFRVDGGRTFDEMRELLVELGYMEADTTESDFLDLLLADLSGDTRYSNEVDLDKLFELTEEDTAEKVRAPAQLRGLTKTDGVHPDTIAEIFGFASGNELVRQIVESTTLSFAIQREAEAIMEERHGDILNDGTLEQQATEAAHNTEQGEALLAELRSLSGQTNVQAITEKKAIKDAAARIIGRKRLNGLRPARYHAAEVKAAKEAAVAKEAGDLEAAQAAKQKQVFNFYLWRAATAARKKSDQMQRKLKGMQTRKYRTRDVKRENIEQMKNLLSAYEFRRSNAQARKQAQAILESVKKWIRDQNIDKESPANFVDAEQLTQVVHIRDMTLDQLQALHDVATNLVFSGRKNSQAEKAEFNERMKVIGEFIGNNTTGKAHLGLEDTKRRQLKVWGRSVAAYHRKLESLVREADGFEDLGPLWKMVIQPLLRANNAKLKMQLKAHDVLDEIFADHDGLFNSKKDVRTFELESGQVIVLSLGGRISLALNWGNEGNREALMNMGNTPMTLKDVETIMATLSEFDMELVQGVWNYIDSFWPQIAEIEKSFTGVTPERVEASEFEVNGNKYKGGYYPLVGDSVLGFKANEEQIAERAKRAAGGGTLHAMTAHGFTIERKNFAGKDIDLSIDVLFRHVDTVIHDVTHRRAVSDVDRVLTNRNIAKALTTALGNEAYEAMKNNVVQVAAGHIHPKELGGIERILRYTRLALTYGSLGFSVKSLFSQTLGLTTAIGEFGAENVSRGVMNFYANYTENRDFIIEHSQFMKDRLKTVNRDTNDILISLQGKTAMNTLRKNSFFLLLQGDLAISRAVWWGQYEVGMDRVSDSDSVNFETEQDAIDFADRSVARTQQSGLLMDLTSIESKNEFVKMWTVMYSAFSAIYQIAVEQTKKAKVGKIDRVQMTYNLMWILIIPALFEELITGRRDDDDEDDVAINNRWTRAMASYSLGTMVGLREIGWIMQSGENSQLPIQRALKIPFDVATQLEQGEIDGAFIRAMTNALSLGHIPGASQLNRSGQYFLAYQKGDEREFDVWEFLVTGPREDE